MSELKKKNVDGGKEEGMVNNSHVPQREYYPGEGIEGKMMRNLKRKAAEGLKTYQAMFKNRYICSTKVGRTVKKRSGQKFLLLDLKKSTSSGERRHRTGGARVGILKGCAAGGR